MTEPYYNVSFGTGLEGVLNYTNSLVGNMMGITFIASLFIIMVYVLNKSEWKVSSNVVFSSFICLLLSWILSLFMEFGEVYLYYLALIFAGSVIWAIIDNQSR
jgi:hypothetical protein